MLLQASAAGPGSWGGATGGAGGATGGAAYVGAFPGAGPDTSEEEEEWQEYAEAVTLAEEESVRLASQCLRHRSASAAHGGATGALATPVPACPGLTATVSSSDASSASSTRTETACSCICWLARAGMLPQCDVCAGLQVLPACLGLTMS
eukprot:scaffold32455_cov57-Phaeocystis_antarctica.AAC.1